MFCALYGMVIIDVTALVLEVLCAKYFLMQKKKIKNGNTTGMQVNPIFTNAYICCRCLEPPSYVDFFFPRKEIFFVVV